MKFTEKYKKLTEADGPTKADIEYMVSKLGEVSKDELWQRFAKEVNNKNAWFEDRNGVYMMSGFTTFNFTPSQLHISINPSNIRNKGESKSIIFNGDAPKDIKELAKAIKKNKIDTFVIGMMEQRRKRAKSMTDFYKGWKNPD